MHAVSTFARGRWTLAPLLFAMVAPLVHPGQGGAQVPDTLRRDTVYDIEPIAVRAVRPATTSSGISAITVRLDSVRFRAVPFLEDVLREVPLVQVRENSRGEAQIAMRGAEERQVAILVDGVPLTLGWDHRTDLSVIPMTAAQSVQVVRGLSTLAHGPNVLGGAVEIGIGSVPMPRVEPLRLQLGTDDTGGLAAGAIAASAVDLDEDRVVIRGGVGYREREGLNAPSAAGAVYPALAGDELRVNSDLRHYDAFVSGRYEQADGTWISASGMGFTAERGVPPELDQERPRLWRYPEVSRFVGVLAAASPLDAAGEGTDIRISIGVDGGRTEIHGFALPATPEDPTLEARPFFSTLDEREESTDRTLTSRAVVSRKAGSRATLRLAGTYGDVSHDEVVTVGLADGSPRSFPAEYRQRLWSLAAEGDVGFDLPDVAGLTGGRITGGVAYDGADTPETGGTAEGRTMAEWGARAGATATTVDGSLLLHGGVSRRGRFPALREMYSTALGRFEANPQLQPEIMTAGELGFTTRRGGFDLQVVGFRQQLDDAIVRGAPPPGSTARYQRVNRTSIQSTGLELLTAYAIGRLALESELTWQDVRVVEPGQEGVRAEYEPEVAVGIGGSIPVALGVEAAGEISYMGRQYCSTPQPGQEAYRELEASTRADLQLARTFHLAGRPGTFSHLGLELGIDNLTDATVYDQCGLPQPGRTLRFQVRLN